MSNNEVVVIGDIGGQRHIFEEILNNLGVDSNYRIPHGKTIIQVGDVARNATPDVPIDSLGCVQIANSLMDSNRENYIQLLGNHEFLYLPLALHRPNWHRIPEVQEIVRSWWANRRVALAATISTHTGNELLVTHAGLTLPYWKRIGSPLSATDATVKLNAYVGRRSNIWSQPGYIVTREVNTHADCVWAEAACELLHPWVLHKGVTPFEQIYGHSLTVNWEDNAFWEKTPDIVRLNTDVDYDARLSQTLIGHLNNGDEAFFYSVDWAMGNRLATQTYGLRTWENSTASADIPEF